MKTTSLASIYFSDFMKHENSYYSGPIFEDPIISIGEYHNGEQLLSNMNKAYKQLNLAVTSVIQSLLLQEK